MRVKKNVRIEFPSGVILASIDGKGEILVHGATRVSEISYASYQSVTVPGYAVPEIIKNRIAIILLQDEAPSGRWNAANVWSTPIGLWSYREGTGRKMIYVKMVDELKNFTFMFRKRCNKATIKTV